MIDKVIGKGKLVNHPPSCPTWSSCWFLIALASAMGEGLSKTREAGTACRTARLSESAISTLNKQTHVKKERYGQFE